MRLAANLAVNRQITNEAGFPNGFNTGKGVVVSVYAGVVEALGNDLSTIGMHVKACPAVRPAH